MTTGSRDAVIWHEVECGSYRADLPLWEELAANAPGPVLELGAGTGRVSLHLARLGYELVAVEQDGDLAGELLRRAADDDLPVYTVRGDMRELSLDERPDGVGLAIAPMHVMHELDAPGRSAVIAASARSLRPGALLAAALVDESDLGAGGSAEQPPPDMREVEGWVFSSEALWVQVTERQISVRRIRQRVSPGGELSRAAHDEVLERLRPDELETEGARLGLKVRERRAIPPGPGEAGSVVVVLEAP